MEGSPVDTKIFYAVFEARTFFARNGAGEYLAEGGVRKVFSSYCEAKDAAAAETAARA